MPPGVYRKGVRYNPRPTSTLRDWGSGLRQAFDAQGNPVADPNKYVGNVYDQQGNVWVPSIAAPMGGEDREYIPQTSWQQGVQERSSSRDWAYLGPETRKSFPNATADTDTRDGSVDDAWAKWAAMLGGGAAGDPQAVQHAEAQRQLDLQEQSLRQAMLDGDMAKAQEALAGIERARSYINQSYRDYNTLVTPHYDQAIRNTSQIYEQNAPALNKIAAEEQAGLAGWFEEGRFDVQREGQLIGADAQAQKDAMGKVGELHGLFVEDAQGRAVSADKVLGALERMANESAKAFKMEDSWEMRNQQRVEDAVWGNRVEGAQDAITDLEYKKQMFELDKQRSKMAHDEALRRLNETGGNDPYMDSIGFGQLTAETFLYDAFNKKQVPLDRQQVLRGALEQAWSEGVFTAEDFRKWLSQTDNNGASRASSIVFGGLSPEEVGMLSDAMRAYGQGRDQYDSRSAAYAESQGGYTVGVNRGGEAPNNKAHAAEARRGEGEYGARAKRVASLIPTITGQFDVRFGGQWRDLNAEVTADRSSNSDHYSGGALDFFGSDAEMKRLASWLSNRSDVSFVKVHGDPPHVHVSFKL